jgi:hypothetical protein
MLFRAARPASNGLRPLSRLTSEDSAGSSTGGELSSLTGPKPAFDTYRSIVVDTKGRGWPELCDGQPWTQQPAAKRTPDNWLERSANQCP